MVYYYDNITHTHYWRYPGPSGQLLKFFAYDDAVTLKYKVTELLRAYPSDRCVVFDDLGEDSLKANLTIGGRTYGFEPYAMFQAVVDVLNATTT
ncbi:hypothetical protein V5799_020703 [Amblyomma americanum]|uniref:Uncharacterized protein n=1 Tax=Amblyomma americanum TaxID=6943 RepID=A0AAQ4ET81_AMBAM